MVVIYWLLIGILVVKGVSYLLRWYEVTGDPAFVPAGDGLGRLARLGVGVRPFVLEYGATLVCLSLWLLESPYRLIDRLRHRDRPIVASARGDGRPLILIHGFFMNPWSLWYWVLVLRRAGRGPIYLLDYYPALGDIGPFVEQLNRLVARVVPDGGDGGDGGDGSVDLVGHSMGGLIAARFMLDHPQRVRRLVAVGTPFHGTRLWHMSVGRSLDQMRPGSDFLRDLAAGLDSGRDAGFLARVTCVYSSFDQMVLPYGSSRLGRPSMSVALSGPGHNGLLLSPKVAAAVCRGVGDG